MAVNGKSQNLLLIVLLSLGSGGCMLRSPSVQSRDCISRKALINVKLIVAAELGRVDVMNSLGNSGRYSTRM